MIFHENRLPADDSHEVSCPICCYFWKSSTICSCRLLQIIGGALWFKTLFFQPADERVLENAVACLHNMGMVERNFQTLREHDFVEILQPYLESTDIETQLTVLATLGKNSISSSS